jgi:hypothetical protein
MDFKIRENRATVRGPRPLSAERAACFRLVKQRYSNNEACWIIGTKPKTGRR